MLTSLVSVHAQDLTPRAYVITPSGSNAVTLSYSYNSGPVFVDPNVLIENFTGHFQTETLSYYHSFAFFGRSASFTTSIPYATGSFSAEVGGIRSAAYRSGLADARARFSFNLRGGPAMNVKQFRSWNERTTLGASLTILVPTGQYDRARLINAGQNRWAFKPELGFTRRRGNWMVDGYGGIWLWTANSAYFPGSSVRTQSPVFNAEAHFGYYLRPRLWVTLDGNFWTGGRSRINGWKEQDEERNSRVGATASLPLTLHHSVKLSYSRGAYVNLGGNYSTLAAAWQYSWIGKE